jgi:hypothetical protein
MNTQKDSLKRISLSYTEVAELVPCRYCKAEIGTLCLNWLRPNEPWIHPSRGEAAFRHLRTSAVKRG